MSAQSSTPVDISKDYGKGKSNKEQIAAKEAEHEKVDGKRRRLFLSPLKRNQRQIRKKGA